MNTYLIVSSFLVSIISFAFLASVTLKGVWSRKNIAFCVFCLSVFVWITSHMFWLLSETEAAATFWIRCLVCGSSVIPYAYLHFVAEMTQRRLQRLVFVGYCIAAVLCVLAYTPYIFSSVEPRMSFKYWPVAGPAFGVYFGGFVGVVVYSYYLLLAQYRESSAAVKNQTKYLILGTGIGFLGATNFLLWMNIPIEPWGHGLSIFYILGIGYSVLRYRLIDVHEMAARILGLTLVAILLGGLSSVLLNWILNVAYPEFSPRSLYFWWGILSLFGLAYMLVSPKVFDALDELVTKGLTLRRFAYRNELKAISSELSGDTIEGNLKMVVERVRPILSLDMAAIYVRSELGLSCVLRAASGREELPAEMSGSCFEALVSLTDGKRKAVFLEEEAHNSVGHSSELSSLLGEQEWLRRTDVLIPMVAHEELLGFMLLGQSKRLGAFSDIDVLLLLNLCSELALSIKMREVERRSSQMEKLVSLGTMAAGLSHELRNPLVSIRTLTSLLKKNPTQLRLTEEFSATVQRDVKRIYGIVDGVSAFAQNTKRPLVPVHLSHAIEETRATIGPRLAEADIQLEVLLEPDLPDVLGDEEQLIQVLQNIIGNARNAICEWDGRPELGRVELRATHRGGGQLERKRWIELLISDNGPGIPDEFRSRIFDPFVTSRDTGMRQGAAGTGLGLAIVSKIIERHQGVIQVETKLGAGTRFRISLPCI